MFVEEIQTKNGVKEKRVRKNYLVDCEAVSVAETKINEYLKDSPYVFEVKVVKESRILEVVG
jgi:hypothetical protein|tara:strand:- start:1776 stop:1961 length:186 start_codon:yes stop_codon:yes gene_type:complete